MIPREFRNWVDNKKASKAQILHDIAASKADLPKTSATKTILVCIEWADMCNQVGTNRIPKTIGYKIHLTDLTCKPFESFQFTMDFSWTHPVTSDNSIIVFTINMLLQWARQPSSWKVRKRPQNVFCDQKSAIPK